MKMKRRTIVLFFLVSISCCIMAQQKGVQFVHGLKWTEVKAKAKAENKYIFVDCFTTWCGPCKMVSTKIFPLEEVGQFFNQNFINVKVQMDKTPHDKEDVKAWYSDVDTIAKIGQVVNYPTFLYFTPAGELIHRYVGAPSEPNEFIEYAKAALDSSTQYISLKKKFESTLDPDLSLLRSMAIAFSHNGDTKNGEGDMGQQCANEFISKSKVKDLLTKENIDFMIRFTHNVSDKGFEIFRQYGASIDSVEGRKISRSLVEGTIFYREVLPLINNQSSPDWNKIRESINSKYPEYSDVLVTKARIIYFGEHKEWNYFVKEVEQWMQIVSKKSLGEDINGYVWTILTSCNDKNSLEKALEWSEIALKQNETDISSLATYANILYVLGRNEEAVKYMQKVVLLAEESDREYMEELLDMMKSGQKINF